MNDFLKQEWFGNSVLAYLTSAAFLVVGWMAVWGFRRIVLGRLKRWAKGTNRALDDVIIQAVDRTLMPLAYVSVLLAAVKGLALPVLIEKSLSILWAVVIMMAIVRVVLGLFR